MTTTEAYQNLKKKFSRRSPRPTTVHFVARLSYVHLDAPWAGKEGNEPKYCVSCIIPKEDTETISAIRKAIDAAVNEGVTKIWKGTKPNTKSSNFKYPLKDGDTDRDSADAAYEGTMFISASSKAPVPTLNRLKERVDPKEIYSGCWGLVAIDFFGFDKGSKGVGAGLNVVMKYADGDRLGGDPDHTKDFDGYDLEPDEDELDDL